MGEVQRLSGEVERVSFSGGESGFCVLRIRADGHPHAVTVVGRSGVVSSGDRISASGSWRSDPRFGKQFKADVIETVAPEEGGAVARWLASGAIEGIGRGLAERLRVVFGEDLRGAIERRDSGVAAATGVGEVLAERIFRAWEEQASLREAALMLCAAGASAGVVARVRKRFGVDALATISSNPYSLCEPPCGAPFHVADAVAGAVGVSPGDPRRLSSAVLHVLSARVGSGDCGASRVALIRGVVDFLSVREGGFSGDEASQAVSDAVDSLVSAGRIVSGTSGKKEAFFDVDLARAERSVSERLLSMASSTAGVSDDARGLLEVGRPVDGGVLTEEQSSALLTLLSSGVSLLCGGPGVGKTTCVKALVSALERSGATVALAAPTGRAAKRLSEAVGRKATTIHRLLGAFRGGFARDASRPLTADVLILDEASMIDVPLMAAVAAALRDGSSLFCVGDPDQLPSVGPGRAFADMIASGRFPVARLRTVHRQRAGSGVVMAAHAVNAGLVPDFDNSASSDVFFAKARSPDEAAALIVDLVASRVPSAYGFDPVSDIQVFSPMRKGPCGTIALNVALKRRLNPSPSSSAEIRGASWSVGDKVMCVRNDPEKDVANGEVGAVLDVLVDSRIVAVSFDGRRVEFSFDEMDFLEQSYACTIHKGQGCETICAIVPVTDDHSSMLTRTLLYTAMTRGRRLVILVGSSRAVAKAVSRVDSSSRVTGLADLLSAAE
jgi:exodeoxyribonuclease V alpha subunit